MPRKQCVFPASCLGTLARHPPSAQREHQARVVPILSGWASEGARLFADTSCWQAPITLAIVAHMPGYLRGGGLSPLSLADEVAIHSEPQGRYPASVNCSLHQGCAVIKLWNRCNSCTTLQDTNTAKCSTPSSATKSADNRRRVLLPLPLPLPRGTISDY